VVGWFVLIVVAKEDNEKQKKQEIRMNPIEK
jgi:hypothetical protein